VLLGALLTMLGLNCCSKWFEQLSSRIPRGVSNHGGWRRTKLPGLCENNCHRVQRPSAHRQLRSIRYSLSIRHYSQFRQFSRKNVHRGSLRIWTKSVCSNVGIKASVMLHNNALLMWDRLTLACVWSSSFSHFPAHNYDRYENDRGNTVEENSSVFLLIPNALVAVSKSMRAIKLYSNKILQFSGSSKYDR